MALAEVFEWRRTAAALASLENLLRCSACSALTAQLRRVGRCEHVLCGRCADEADTRCPMCRTPCEARDCLPDTMLSTLVHGCQQLRQLLRLPRKDGRAPAGDDAAAADGAGGDAAVSVPADPPPPTIPSPQELAVRVVEAARDIAPPSSNSARDEGSRKNKADSENTQRKRMKASSAVDDKKKSSAAKLAASERRQRSEGAGRGSNVPPVPPTAPSPDTTARIAATAAAQKLNKKNAKGETPLHVACVRDDVQRVRELLASGAWPNVCDNAGWTPLHEACDAGRTELVQLLLAAGAVVDAAGGEHRTPLHDAVSGGKYQVAALLVAAGADPDARALYGQTPRQMAAGNADMLAALETPREADTSAAKYAESGVSVGAAGPLSEPVLVASSGLSQSESGMLKEVARKFGWKMKAEVAAGVTHLVTGGGPADSVLRLRALQLGVWVVGADWLAVCRQSPAPAPPDPWELTGASGQLARRRRRQLRPPLFSGLHVYLHGEFEASSPAVPNRKQLSQLLQLAGAVLLSRSPNPESIPDEERTVPYHAPPGSALRDVSHLVIYQQRPSMRYDMPHVKSLPLDWLLLSLESYSLPDPIC